MVTADGYSIEELPSENKLVLMLSQLYSTTTSTGCPVSNRKGSLTDDELLLVLSIVRSLYEGD